MLYLVSNVLENDDMNQEKIGEFIKKIRKDNHLTQKEFAELFGVTYQAVSKWENGLNIPDISTLKEISKKFNVDINDLLEGENKRKNYLKKYIFIGACVLVVVSLFLVYQFTHNHDFTFKTVRSSCNDFSVLGSMAYNDNKTSIYISSINCLNMDEEKYFSITCILYEQVDNTKTEISRSTYDGDPITLNDYLKDVEFNIDDYDSTCDDYRDDSLYIELRATNSKGDTITHEIPLTLNDNCSNSTSS